MSESTDVPTLYSFCISSCAWRVRIALEYKGIIYNTIPIHLRKGENKNPEFLKISPMGQIPAFTLNGKCLSQSIAIMEYIEEIYPEKSLLPNDPFEKAKVREMVNLIASGIQPLQNLYVQKKHSEDPKEGLEWGQFWIHRGFEALEKILAETSTDGNYCFKDSLTLADCCFIPQVANAIRFKVDLTKYPLITKINNNLAQLEAMKRAHPNQQIDYVPDIA